MDEIYTIEEAAKYLKLSKDTIRRFIRTGKLRASKIGGQYRIKKADLEASFQQRVPQPEKPNALSPRQDKK